MQKRRRFFYNFYFFLLISLIIFVLSYFGYLNFIKTPFEKAAIFIFAKDEPSKISVYDKVLNENKELIKQLAEKKSQEKDIIALKDQFLTSYPRSQNLLTAKIVGAPKFIPGISEPEELIINKGLKDGVKKGQAVVFKGNLVGKVSETSSYLSRVEILIKDSFSFTAKILAKEKDSKEILGVIKSKEGQIILENVLLSDSLISKDLVLSKGDLDINGLGIPPDLIIGEITSIEKKPSALFQTASIKSFVDFSRLNMVFVVGEIK